MAKQSSPPTLETLPAELKRDILDSIPDIQTLNHLVHASPVFHCIYRLHREDIFRDTTFRTLKARNIEIWDTPVPSLRVNLCNNARWQAPLYQAIRTCFQQMHQGKTIKLDILGRMELLTIQDAVPFTMVSASSEDGDADTESPLWDRVRCSRPGLNNAVPDGRHGRAYGANSWSMDIDQEKLFPMGLGNYQYMCFGRVKREYGQCFLLRKERKDLSGKYQILIGQLV